jgi:outer membrane protein TolC
LIARKLAVSLLAFFLFAGTAALGAETLTLQQVRALALRSHPAGAEADSLARLGRAELTAARVWNDPEVEVGWDRAKQPGSGGEGRSESAWRLTQEIPFPLAYSHRVSAAKLAALSLASEGRAKRLLLLFQVEVAYFDLAAAEERLALFSESAGDAEKVLTLVSKRVELGESRESERLRAEIELLRQRRALEGARREAEVFRSMLRRLCGPELPADFEIERRWPARGALGPPESLPGRLLERNPELAAARFEAGRAAEARRSASWGVFPSLKAGLFGANEIDRRARGFTLGFSVPLWNANRPAIARESAQAALASASYRRLQIELENALDAATRSFALACGQAEAYRARLLPAARESQRLARLAYEEGETSFLELLDAQRTLREAVAEFLDVNRQAAASYAEVRRLTGEMLDDLDM